mgnify:CR=1 FL=1|jgi:hypothetical protein
MEKIPCPECTFLNSNTNTNCDICDTNLKSDTELIANPLEEEFMNLTGSNRSSAQEYLKITNNNIDKSVGLYYQDEELGMTNSEFINQTENMMTSLFQLVNSTLAVSHQKPKNIKDLVCQLLYNRGNNEPHHCIFCDSKAFLTCAKLLSYNNNRSELIRFFHREDLNELKINDTNYTSSINEIYEIINNHFIPLINNKIVSYISTTYSNRDTMIEENNELEFIEDTMDTNTGPDFRIIWDTLHSTKDKLDESEIIDTLKILLVSDEFHSYLNQSWETPEYNHPASNTVISNLKKVKLTDECIETTSLLDSKCAICLMQFKKEDDKEITLLGCHSFCSECILPWLENHNDTCPICRKKVDSLEENADEENANEEECQYMLSNYHSTAHENPLSLLVTRGEEEEENE